MATFRRFEDISKVSVGPVFSPGRGVISVAQGVSPVVTFKVSYVRPGGMTDSMSSLPGLSDVKAQVTQHCVPGYCYVAPPGAENQALLMSNRRYLNAITLPGLKAQPLLPANSR